MLRVRLFGGMAVEIDGDPVPPPDGGRARALLAWLALHPGMHSRAELAARFWPDGLDSSARGSLRSAMWALRRALGEGGERHLVATRDRVGLEDVEVDARRFEELGEHGRRGGAARGGGRSWWSAAGGARRSSSPAHRCSRESRTTGPSRRATTTATGWP